MATQLSDNLRPASFRGVPFQVDSTDLGAGRRTQLHEYPQRDKPWVEDLGRAARELSFDGFVIGADYVAQANELLAALEESGPGTLIHPWFGTLTVSIKDLARVSFNSALGHAKFTLSFIESGELTFPLAGDSTTAQSRLAADKLQSAVVNDFEQSFDVEGFQDFVVTQAAEDISAVFAALSSASVPGIDVLGYATRALASLKDALTQLFDPSDLAATLTRFLGIAGYASSDLRWPKVTQSLIQLVSHPTLAVPAASSVYTASRQQAQTNRTAIRAISRQLLLVQAVGASSLDAADVYEETVWLRQQLIRALDSESLQASDAVYSSLVDARGAIWRDLTARARDGARLTHLSPPETTPALVLAYNYYEDAMRSADIVTRNSIRHPGFVPPMALKVLTR